MRVLRKFLQKSRGKTLLAIFPHPDDESFVAGGLLSEAAKYGVKVKVISLTDGRFDEKADVKELEFKKAVHVLNIHESEIWKYKEGQLKDFKEEVTAKLKRQIEGTRPFAVVSFDPNGITGHPDHIISSILILKLLKSLKGEKPMLLWRVSDKEEKNYFYKNKGLLVDKSPTYIFKLPLMTSVKKLRAIFTYGSQFKNPFYRMRIFDWYLFDHKEGYYSVDFESDKYDIAYK